MEYAHGVEDPEGGGKRNGHRLVPGRFPPCVLPVSHKTIHLINLRPSASEHEALVTGLRASRPSDVARVDRTADGVELVVPDASREAALLLARRLSRRYPRVPVRAYLRVNAYWLPRGAPTAGPRAATQSAHVVDVDVSAGAVNSALERSRPSWTAGGVHVQASGIATQIVLPTSLDAGELRRVADWVKAHLSEARVSPNRPGRWIANGSRHHDVERFLAGVRLSNGAARLWTDED